MLAIKHLFCFFTFFFSFPLFFAPFSFYIVFFFFLCITRRPCTSKRCENWNKEKETVCVCVYKLKEKNKGQNHCHFLSFFFWCLCECLNFLFRSKRIIFSRMGMKNSMIILAVFVVASVRGFYLPGLAPNVFCRNPGDDPKCKVSRIENEFPISRSSCFLRGQWKYLSIDSIQWNLFCPMNILSKS